MCLACHAPPAFAQIYKCVTQGKIAFQDSPCPAQARATVIETRPPPDKDMFTDLPPEPPPTTDDLIRKTGGYAPPVTVSFDLLVPLIHKFQARERQYQADMERDIQTARARFYEAMRQSGPRQGMTSTWERDLHERSQRVAQLTAEDVRMHRAYVTALRAALGTSTSADVKDPGAIDRVHAAWNTKLRDIDARLRTAVKAMSRQNRADLARMRAYHPTRDIHLLQKGLMEYERRVQRHWMPYIRVTKLQIQGLRTELKRRCAADPVLAAQRKACMLVASREKVSDKLTGSMSAAKRR